MTTNLLAGLDVWIRCFIVVDEIDYCVSLVSFLLAAMSFACDSGPSGLGVAASV